MRVGANRFRGNIGWTWWPRAPMGPRPDGRDWERCGAYHDRIEYVPRHAAVIAELARVRLLAREVYLQRPTQSRGVPWPSFPFDK